MNINATYENTTYGYDNGKFKSSFGFNLLLVDSFDTRIVGKIVINYIRDKK